ncbi:MAG: hypothetical protein ACM3JD_05725 [Rudaea sp.]
MASDVNAAAAPALIEPSSIPYPPSWVDGLIRWIDRLPVPAWLFYPALLAGLFLIINAGRWLEGIGPLGSLDAPYGFIAIYPVTALAAIDYLDRTARRAFEFFRPALGKPAAEAARLEYELTVLPAREARLVAVAGGAFGVLLVLGGNTARPSVGSGIFYWTLIGAAIVGIVLTSELFYHTVRQLKLVTRIHATASNVDLFHYTPLYSFSALTARTGLVFSLILWFDLTINPETLTNLPLIGLNVAILLLSAACFVLPLEGMHNRMVAEKRELEWDANQRIKAVVAHLYGTVDEHALGEADEVNKTISSLLATRDLIGKIPTWPWRPQTFTAFFSALALPVVVFLIQMLLKTAIGFK